jgi:hypothetical protein
MADAASDAYNTGLQDALDHYGLPASEDMGFVNKAGMILGEMLGQIPLVPLSAANKVRQGAQVVGGAMPFIKKALMAIPEYLGPTIEPTVANYAIGTAGGMAFPPALEGLMRMYKKYSPELEYEVPDTDMRGMLDDIGDPIDRESDKRVAQWVAEQRGPSDERARIADNVRRSMMTPGFAKGGQVEHIPEFITGKTGNYVQGAGDGQSDSIPAMLADGEYVFDADTVAALGNGSNKAGAQVLDKMRESIREHKRSAPVGKIPPKAKSPLSYLKGMK